MIESTTANPASDPAVRRTMIGASDGAAILGLQPYGKTPLSVGLEKRGLLAPADLSGVEVVQYGKLLENYIGTMYTMRTGRLVLTCPVTFRHPEYDFIGCHPDFSIDGENGGVEAKAVNITHPVPYEQRLEWGEEGTDQAPMKFLVQCHHQMLVTGWDFVDLTALIGGRGLCIYRVLRDTAFLHWYTVQLINFWNDVVIDGRMPEPVTLGDCKLLYPKDNGAEIEGDAKREELWRMLMAVRGSKDILKLQEDDLAVKIKAYMGEASVLRCADQVAATWRKNSKGARIFLPKTIREVE